AQAASASRSCFFSRCVRPVRAFGATIAARMGLAVHFHDERLSSFEADQRMARSGRTHREKRQLRDALAACAILEAYRAEPG
ncbi:MAG: Holliday junction resolvase RuvX, partial [Phycisphaerales bacterium]